ncbi:hypothetical protein A3J90_06205 [candidate division WOR-1 bacterium RIFOXYC2_FULL_37_10]|uniref:Com family DNA-binding transcriptional regulator n=1 Tax=candidate division WOR-1 bacterium RIFOXYB2_FULL_37_13 TaxID=1802579 RepID=A0A1F4SWA3_UNCSA|nr:MAG: hypothetical protein A2246_05220 [candidate division WOR-1 bacterium RIFOXYA2_FULL_37_7]OGC24716.1 MAG: hypothetical protein A2310_04445 [candidate division WOR-1 bacterium RIFOXYB2_FULL_37_13]OGC34823.1 MAG: hypothetical protein A3J90_06205 [candidate division WOR-1 bacterium RIFOXYC2_FULL_37_10]
MKEFRCSFCNRLLAKVGEGSNVEIKCPKCKSMNLYNKDSIVVYEIPENNVTKKIIERRKELIEKKNLLTEPQPV